jgi:hypothetical protein
VSYHLKAVTDCCGAHEVCGPYCDGAHQSFCDECGNEVCSKCAGLYEPDAECVGDPAEYVWCGTIVCKDCRAEAAKEIA